MEPVVSSCAEIRRNADSVTAIRLFLPSSLEFHSEAYIGAEHFMFTSTESGRRSGAGAAAHKG